MGNQQPSDLRAIHTIARNAVFGDGYLWKHPECRNYKCIFTSTNIDILKMKMSIAPSMFPSGISLYRKAGTKTNYSDNSKALYKLASVVHPIFTQYKQAPKHSMIKKMTEFDFLLWYLDDGCFTGNIDKPMITLSIGNTATTPEGKENFLNKLFELFGHIKTRDNTIGQIRLNNSKATEFNLIWVIPKPIGIYLSNKAAELVYIPKKSPHVKGSETIPSGSTATGI